jgi:hypothetical protein
MARVIHVVRSTKFIATLRGPERFSLKFLRRWIEFCPVTGSAHAEPARLLGGEQPLWMASCAQELLRRLDAWLCIRPARLLCAMSRAALPSL